MCSAALLSFCSFGSNPILQWCAQPYPLWAMWGGCSTSSVFSSFFRNSVGLPLAVVYPNDANLWVNDNFNTALQSFWSLSHVVHCVGDGAHIRIMVSEAAMCHFDSQCAHSSFNLIHQKPPLISHCSLHANWPLHCSSRINKSIFECAHCSFNLIHHKPPLMSHCSLHANWPLHCSLRINKSIFECKQMWIDAIESAKCGLNCCLKKLWQCTCQLQAIMKMTTLSALLLPSLEMHHVVHAVDYKKFAIGYKPMESDKLKHLFSQH